MLLEDYAKTRPYLYHLTHRDNLKHIREMGRLFPCAILMERSGKTELMRTPRRGPQSVLFEGREIKLRDQDPLHRGNARLPRGYTFSDLVEAINRRIFFWPGANAGPTDYGVRHFERYKQEKPVILRMNFESLVRMNPAASPLFCRYNSGSPRCSNGNKSPRGPNTFLLAADFNETPSKVVEVTFAAEILLPATTQFGLHPVGPWKKLL